MAKIALLIGVSEYLPEFPALPSAVKDVEAMKEVLGNSEMGGFDDIEVLKNSNRQQIEEAIYDLFADRNKDDVLLFYFSGHGVKSREGNLFLAISKTRKGQRGIVTPTAVGASVLQSHMN
ncbi:MAG: caspase family protein, partial [Okeania sp. SIO3C4]|nr:caspase family protein [Okeania sp. SIO3C4]